MPKSISELNTEISELISGRDRVKVENLLRRKFRVGSFGKLNADQLAECPEILRDAIYKGEI